LWALRRRRHCRRARLPAARHKAASATTTSIRARMTGMCVCTYATYTNEDDRYASSTLRLGGTQRAAHKGLHYTCGRTNRGGVCFHYGNESRTGSEWQFHTKEQIIHIRKGAAGSLATIPKFGDSPPYTPFFCLSPYHPLVSRDSIQRHTHLGHHACSLQ